jgi:hypothetical protein
MDDNIYDNTNNSTAGNIAYPSVLSLADAIGLDLALVIRPPARLATSSNCRQWLLKKGTWIKRNTLHFLGNCIALQSAEQLYFLSVSSR